MDDFKNDEQNQETNNQSSDKIQELEAAIVDLNNNWKRALADYQNLQKRYVEEREEMAAFSSIALISRLLPVLDNLEMLDEHLKDVGLKMVLKEFKQILNDEGLAPVPTENVDFDAYTMEAVEIADTEHLELDGKPIKVERNGYFLKRKLIRPARVIVGKFKSEESDK